jgi:hypothetical protein
MVFQVKKLRKHKYEVGDLVKFYLSKEHSAYIAVIKEQTFDVDSRGYEHLTYGVEWINTQIYMPYAFESELHPHKPQEK